MSVYLSKARRMPVLAVALAGTIAGGAVPALADGPTYSLRFKQGARLLPLLHGTELLDAAEESREYDYTTKGYFKVRGHTVARLSTFSGHADQTREYVRLSVSRSARHTIRAAAKRQGTRRVTLTLVHRLTLTTNIPGDMTSRTKSISQDVFLTIPRD